jgi:hypothetical protein
MEKQLHFQVINIRMLLMSKKKTCTARWSSSQMRKHRGQGASRDDTGGRELLTGGL